MANDTKIRRVKASEADVVKEPKKTAKTAKAVNKKTGFRNKSGMTGKKTHKIHAPKWLAAVGRALGKVFGPAGRYLKGAWQELRVTKWPNRRATWGLTVAVICFSIFFAVLILSFDNVFKWLLELVLNIGGK